LHVFNTTEIAAALLQAAVTVGLAGLFLYLFLRHRKPHFLWWAIAWGLYAGRVAAIITFLSTDSWAWLYWHQVTTGWTALAVLWAALVFSRQVPWKSSYWALLLFPPVWSWIAIFRLDNFMLAAGVTVVLLSAATLWTGIVFFQYRRRTGSSAAGILALTLLLWGVHHLDYPILRARGAWNPWGYYLDLLFVLTMGVGILLLVIEELRQGLVTLSTLSGDLRRRDRDDPLLDLLKRPLALRGVRGTALVSAADGVSRLVNGTGECSAWVDGGMPKPIAETVARAFQSHQPILQGQHQSEDGVPPFVAVLPIGGREPLALVVVSDVSAPFTALDDGILVAVSEQIGAAMENLEMDRALMARSADLERLSVRMIQQHEEQRLRIARELHDETAQVFAGLKLQLGALREALPSAENDRVDRLLTLVDTGSKSIRNVTDDLRPALLDDLGLLPALRALISDFREWSGLEVDVTLPEQIPPMGADADLALFRAVQEGLSNVARHAQATRVEVEVRETEGNLRLVIEDDGEGLAPDQLARVMSGPGRSGLFGMRERIVSVGGTVELTSSSKGTGLRLRIVVPLERRSE
jgi:signal transduction histidine kinase